MCWKVVQLGCRTLRIFQRPKQLRNFSDRPWRSIRGKSFSIGHIRYLTSASSRSGCLRICPASMLSPLHRATWAKTSTPGQDMCDVTRQGRSKEVDTKPLWHEWMLSELKCVVLHSYYTTVVQVGSCLPSGSHCFSPQFLMLNLHSLLEFCSISHPLWGKLPARTKSECQSWSIAVSLTMRSSYSAHQIRRQILASYLLFQTCPSLPLPTP